ncbi:glycosyltransferase family protein [Sphingomonas abietis]|uniref:Glucuronosyltransferase n=1 Tax=Sphingomonas abietis TaxID=3012344 RepID=A0ABY7NH86_9SPHN|nr:glucuronosyltransferase [Sphingomonas abietis]WBO20854.1 glucuronosyltransferase [Sphingomonas abietis]
MSDRSRDFTVLAVSSGGGHWEELLLLRPAFSGFNLVFATTNAELAERDHIDRFLFLPDANRDEIWRSVLCFFASIRLIMRLRPNVVITTGALPGLFCLIAARLTRAHTVWIDSIANSDKPSLSGRVARPFAHEWFTQWAHLATRSRRYDGALL